MDYFFYAFGHAFGLIFSFDQEVYSIAWTSIRISTVAILCATVLGVPLGLLISFQDFPGKRLLLQILNTLMALPTVVVGLLLYGMFTRQGPLGAWGILYTPTAVIIGECILVLPIIWNLSITAAESADPRLGPTCKSLGASGLQQGIIFIQEVRFALMAAVVTGFGRAIGEVGVAMMVGGNIAGETRVLTTAIVLAVSRGDFGLAIALGIILMVLVYLVNLVLTTVQQRSKAR